MQIISTKYKRPYAYSEYDIEDEIEAWRIINRNWNEADNLRNTIDSNIKQLEEQKRDIAENMIAIEESKK